MNDKSAKSQLFCTGNNVQTVALSSRQTLSLCRGNCLYLLIKDRCCFIWLCFDYVDEEHTPNINGIYGVLTLRKNSQSYIVTKLYVISSLFICSFSRILLHFLCKFERCCDASWKSRGCWVSSIRNPVTEWYTVI